MMRQVQKMQDEITALQADLEQREFTGTAGGGVVEVTINGKRNVLKLDIKPEVVDPEDVETLQDLVMAAFNQAVANLDEVSDTEMQKLTGGVKRTAFGTSGRAICKAPWYRHEVRTAPCLLCYVHDRRGSIGFCSGYH